MLVNGVATPPGNMVLQEDLLKKKVHPQHLWALICDTIKLSQTLALAYNEAQYREGEITREQAEKHEAYIRGPRPQASDPLVELMRKGRPG